MHEHSGELGAIAQRWLPGAPAPFDEQGKFLQIYRKQGDGSWKMTREIYNSDLPLPMPVPAPPPKG